MAKMKDPPWLLLGAFAAGLWWLFSSPASAATAPASSKIVNAAAKKYLDQIMAAQNAFTSGSKSQSDYTALAASILLVAQVDPSISTADLAYLRAVAGA
jgi:hypothetical protein